MRAYDYWWGYSSAQIDLMIADQPLVVYPKSGSKKMTKARAEATYKKWKERKEKEGGDMFVGKKVSLGDFLK